MSRQTGGHGFRAALGAVATVRSLLPLARSSRVWTTVVVLVLVTSLTGGCSAAESPRAGDTTTLAGSDPTSELRALEAPVLRALKAASSAFSANNPAAASDALEQIGRDGRAILEWLDAHPDFVKANRSSTECLEETMKDLGEQAETVAPALRAGTATGAQVQKLKADLGEAANCIQASD